MKFWIALICFLVFSTSSYSIATMDDSSWKSDRGSELYYLATIYKYGLGVEKDPEKSYVLYLKADRAGYRYTEEKMEAAAYSPQKDSPADIPDLQVAVEWYKKSANNNDKMAQACLGYLYDEGIGVDVNYSEAIKWYTKAANNDVLSSQYYLGAIYHLGKDKPANLKKAIKWYTKAADNDYGPAFAVLGDIYFQGKDVAKDYEKANNFYSLALYKGHIEVLANVTNMANQGIADAQFILGQVYEGKLIDSDIDHKSPIKEDYVKAIKWYTKAALQDHNHAIVNLAYIHRSDQHYQKAIDWYTKVAKNGDLNAQVSLGNIYMNGDSYVDYQKALKWYTKATQNNNMLPSYWHPSALKSFKSSAKNGLGEIYQDGLGVPIDYVKSYAWFWQGGNNDSPWATTRLEKLEKLMTKQQIEEAKEMSSKFE